MDFLSSISMSVMLSIGIVTIIVFLRSLGELGRKILSVIVFFIVLGIAFLTFNILVPDFSIENLLTEIRKIK